jgi:hypothetical protein
MNLLSSTHFARSALECDASSHRFTFSCRGSRAGCNDRRFCSVARSGARVCVSDGAATPTHYRWRRTRRGVLNSENRFRLAQGNCNSGEPTSRFLQENVRFYERNYNSVNETCNSVEENYSFVEKNYSFPDQISCFRDKISCFRRSTSCFRSSALRLGRSTSELRV